MSTYPPFTPTDWVDDVTMVDEAQMDRIETGIVNATNAANDLDTKKLAKDEITVAGTRLVLTKLASGDTEPAFRIMGDGTMEWGGGGTTAPEIKLQRIAANVLRLFDARIDFERNLATDGVITALLQGETTGRFTVLADGMHQWGDGAAARDTFLTRGAVGILTLTGTGATGHLFTSGQVRSQQGQVGQVTIGNLPATASIVFGSANDANLYRQAAAVLATDGGLDIRDQLYFTRQAGAANILYAARAGDATPYRFIITNEGRMEWGPGGGAARDAFFYRVSASHMVLDGALLSVYRANATDTALATRRMPGDAASRWYMSAGGTMNWGDGTVVDTNLYRAAADTLQTDDTLRIMRTAGGWALNTFVSGDTQMRFVIDVNGIMLWGPGNAAQDIQLNRIAANQLGIGNDDSFHLGTGVGGTTAFIQLWEQAGDVAAPPANAVRLYAKDVAGKTQLMIRFATGSPMGIGAEP